MHNHHHEITSHEELVALLSYMVNHNKSHTTELEKLTDKLENTAELKLAIEAYKNGNAHLENVLKELEG